MTRGVPRAGKALLAGLLYCGECAHKMMVRYSGATRYLCTFFHQQYGDPFCQNLPAEPLDAAVVGAFFEAALRASRSGQPPRGGGAGAQMGGGIARAERGTGAPSRR
jgi:hypothetical protein